MQTMANLERMNWDSAWLDNDIYVGPHAGTGPVLALGIYIGPHTGTGPVLTLGQSLVLGMASGL